MLKVLKSGFYTTIQDLGRFGYRDIGVPVSGAMDYYSYKFANALLGNDFDAASLEMTMVGGSFQFKKPVLVAVAGADMLPTLNDKPIKNFVVLSVKTNDILKFGRATKGFRTYLAVKGGFLTENVLDSRSQYQTITSKSSLEKNDELKFPDIEERFGLQNASVKYDDSLLHSHVLEAFAGPEFNRLNEDHRQFLFQNELKVSKLNNRMAYQLEPLLENNLEPILTAPVLPGTVQLTPSGNLIVLMRDGQTTGGYPRVLQLTENAINCLSQKSTGKILKIRLKE